MIDFHSALEKSAYRALIDFLNNVATTGQPNEISQDWLVHIPQNETFEHLLSERGLKAKFMPSTGCYFVSREHTQRKR